MSKEEVLQDIKYCVSKDYACWMFDIERQDHCVECKFRELYNCVANILSEIWNFLKEES